MTTPRRTPGQEAAFDRLAAGGELYRYPAGSIKAIDGLVAGKRRVLDLGCGDGVLTARLDARFAAGVDRSLRCAALARRRGVCALVADMREALPFRDGAFDTVHCINVLHHLHGAWDGLLGEIARVLEPGGTLAIVEPDARNAFVRITQAPGSWLRVAPCNDEPAVSPNDLTPLLERQGFTFAQSTLQLEGDQADHGAFPLWQRVLKAPFVLGLWWLWRKQPNKLVCIARKEVPNHGV